ncbi:MAG: PQQ-binding-like beta-propeller repeat protein [Actinobacteria bacterium]|nr:PQQ-binding-like beta-propeller repeat protein [Actinomycetota bacterium]
MASEGRRGRGAIRLAGIALAITLASVPCASALAGTTQAREHRQLARSLPSARTCKGSRFYVRLHAPVGDPLKSATVWVNRKRVAHLTGEALTRRFRVHGLPSTGRFRVRIVARTQSGRRLVVARHFRRCAPGIPKWAQAPMPGCASLGPSLARGDWPMLNHDLSGTRDQPRERALTPSVVPSLSPRFLVAVSKHGMSGIFEATPSESNGCVYMGTSDGWLFAANADTGKIAWKTKLPVGAAGLLGTGIVGAPTIDRGRVIVAVSQAGSPYAAAVDQRTGKPLWIRTLETQTGAYNDASPVVFDGLVFMGFNGDESTPAAHGGFDVLDERTGHLLVKTYTVPPDEFKKGYNGGSIWATAAIDPARRFAYVGTGNPQGPNQWKYDNAIIKVDLDRRHGTFGKIVNSYSGDPDAAIPVEQQPTCQATRGQIIYVVSVGCTHEDVDFGASPQLFRDGSGRQVVGELQKSGIYHVAHTDDMARAWTTKVGSPGVITNGGTGATDGRDVYVEGTPPGVMFKLDGFTGASMWQQPVGDQVHFQGTTVAAGVVYTVDSANNFRAWDAAAGTPLIVRALGPDTGGDTSGSGNGTGGTSTGGTGPSDSAASVSVARGTVYLATGGDLLAYRP